ncbi:MAG: thioredoxin-dependent thiol peroxidase [Gemmatimonadaceae bacterium]
MAVQWAPSNIALPQRGTPAPDFTLLTDSGEPLTLSALRGKAVVLFFYPKDDTPACTAEACELRDAFPKFDATNTVILGISPDSVKKHVRFRSKYGLPFQLLADTEHVVAELYGVWGEKQLWGRRYMGMLRTTFVIDTTGNIVHVFEKVSAKGHAAAIFSVIDSLT